MFAGIQRFVTRHRRKFIILGITVGGTILIARYAKQKLIDMQESNAKEFFEKARRLQHFESTERTCNEAISRLSANLCDEILKLLNTDAILEKLRSDAVENKIDLWQNLKMVAFTRLTTLIYATTVFVVTLRIQLNVLGGYLYKDTKTTDKKVTEEIQQAYLSLIQYFQSDGLDEMVKLIECKVRPIVETYPLTKKLNLSDIEQIFWSIQMAVNSDPMEPNSNLSHYVFPPSVNETGGNVLHKMFNETLDVLESDDVAALCANNISRGFTIAVDQIAEYFTDTTKTGTVALPASLSSSSASTATAVAHGSSSPGIVVNINQLELPLAKIIPILSGITSNGYDGKNSSRSNLATCLITFFTISDKIKTLGANVYEVFSL